MLYIIKSYLIEKYYQITRKTGVYKTKYSNGNIGQKWNFVNGYLNGKSYLYYENGDVICEANFKDNILDGKSIIYYDNGNISDEINFIDGELSGKHIINYYHSGFSAYPDLKKYGKHFVTLEHKKEKFDIIKGNIEFRYGRMPTHPGEILNKDRYKSRPSTFGDDTEDDYLFYILSSVYEHKIRDREIFDKILIERRENQFFYRNHNHKFKNGEYIVEIIERGGNKIRIETPIDEEFTGEVINEIKNYKFGGLLHGSRTSYFEYPDKVDCESYYENGELVGKQTYYQWDLDRNQKWKKYLYKVINWKDGKKYGEEIIYNDCSDKVDHKINWKDGKKHGIHYIYNYDGSIFTKTRYKNGKEIEN